jgi:sulfite exporter TauE/SafE
VSLLAFQPILGLLHHYKYRQIQRRTFWSHAHIWFGRCLLIVGVINGGLGLQLAGNTMSGEIAYAVVAGVILIIYLVVASYGEMKRSRSLPPVEDKQSVQNGYRHQIRR